MIRFLCVLIEDPALDAFTSLRTHFSGEQRVENMRVALISLLTIVNLIVFVRFSV